MMSVASRANLDRDRDEVAGMFDETAPRYDLMNDVMSLGRDRAWRREVVRALAVSPGERVLDLAAGTGTSSVPFARAGAAVYPTDLSMGMLRTGKQRQPHLEFVCGDATHLPYGDRVFDATTISFGLRNVEDTLGALRELRRVTRDGGRLVICEFSRPTWAPFRWVYQSIYLTRVMPLMSRVSANPVSYDYLADTILAWHDQPHLAELMAKAGWGRIAWRNLTGGIVALHRGQAI
ncbi:Ubiquinone/menaquinone biosynthesis methyltransferase ubiE [Propionibacterium australiense]|uniref:Demethylmenaquinone methyltransferase n=2 Tax=Propionibacterium australiense TaxID=119981 RepID=A0A383S5J2_9ACTN|nr:demethylmenaquinone methyltransferase [Propionibacterium australiense]RLP12623.1 demethylmenaquinone methyltransferase [Propionibacterium australiense]SYZ32546.1 demethylmenaquinone methyltransferase [Propionibacterium australiense]VEH91703.1 Ubiquinone/menaquinone biosynthesis methyltransferase ubiE [Propionibacterium australiense]